MSINGSRGLSGFHLDRSKSVVAVMKLDGEGGSVPTTLARRPSSRPHNWSWKIPNPMRCACPVSLTAGTSAYLCTEQSRISSSRAGVSSGFTNRRFGDAERLSGNDALTIRTGWFGFWADDGHFTSSWPATQTFGGATQWSLLFNGC
jgi:hypothetical protein